MKVRIYPSKEVVRKLAQEELEEAVARLTEAQASLDAFNGGPDDSFELGNLAYLAEVAHHHVKHCARKLLLVDSHVPEEVAVEIVFL